MSRSWSLLLPLLAACGATPPQPAEPALPEVPTTWAGAALEGAVAPGSWWASIDPELGPLVEEALRNNQDLRVAGARLRMARSAAEAAGASQRPSLDLGLGGQRRQQNFIGFPIPGGGGEVLSTTTTTYDAGLSLAWEVDLWDRLGATARAAALDELSAEAERRAAVEAVTAATVRAWLVGSEAQLQEDLARRTLAAWEESESVVLQRYEAGLAGALDLRLARASTASARAALSGAVQVHAEGRRQLELVLGRYPAAAQASAGRLAADLPPAPAGVPVELLGRRPDLVAARARYEAARERAGAARAELWPRLTLTGSTGSASSDLEDLLDGDFSVWGLAARLAAPLYDGGRRRAVIEGADAACEQAAAELANGVLRAASEVERALDAEVRLRERGAHLGAALEESAAAAQLARERYAAGLVDVITLLEAQRGRLAAESQHLAARRDLYVSRVDLHLALGGGFDEEP